MIALTLRSSRTPPAFPSVLSRLLANLAPLVASVQARPLSFIVRPLMNASMSFRVPKAIFSLTAMFLISNGLACRRPAIQDQPDAVAKSYSISFLLGDYKTASTLVHPDALAGIRSAFLDGLSQVRGTSEEKSYLDAFGGRSGEELEKLSPVDLFIALREGADKKTPPDFEFRKQAKIELMSSQLTGPNNATVRLKFIPSTGPLDLSFEVSYELVLLRSEWKILREIRKPK